MLQKSIKIQLGTSMDEQYKKKFKILSKYRTAVSKEFDSVFETNEEKAIANIALEVSSRLLFEYLKKEAEYGR